MTQELRTLQQCEWKCYEFSDENLLSLIEKLKQKVDKFEVLELCTYYYDNGDTRIHITLRSHKSQKLDGSAKHFEVHRYNPEMEETDDSLTFKQEAYRIKRFLKKRYHGICVTSSFSWR